MFEPVVMFTLVSVKVPLTLNVVLAATELLDLLIVRLLNVVVVAPPIAWAEPFVSVTVLPVAVKVPSFVKSPLMSWVNDPVVKDAVEPTVKLPVVLRAARAVAEAVPDTEKLPAIVRVEPGMVFVLLPLKVRWW